jgi:hypothetical protein
MELAQIVETGKQLGLEGEALRKFVVEERERAEVKENERIKREEKKEKERIKQEKEDKENERLRREEEMEKERLRKEEEKEKERLRKEEEKERLREEKEKERLRKEEELTLQIRARDADEQAKENAHRRMLEMKEKEIEMMKIAKEGKEKKSGEIEVRTNRPKLPKFDEDKDDMDSYLERFEIFATVQNWKTEEWSISLSALLTGKGLQVFTSMPTKDIKNYNKLKNALLKRYQLTEEGFRRKFRDAHPEDNESAYQFIARIKRYFQRWVELTEIEKSYDGLQELLIKEQYINTCSAEMKIYLRERAIKDIDELVSLAERYTEARYSEESTENQPKKQNVHQAAGAKQEEGYRSQQGEKRCFICKKTNHVAKECYFNEANKKPWHNRNGPRQQRNNETAGVSVAQRSKAGTEINKTHTMPICEGMVNGYHASVLRDTGCSTAAIREDLVGQTQFTGEETTCILIDGTQRKFPLASVYIDTPFYTGQVEAMAMKQPIADIILGNIAAVRDEPDPAWGADRRSTVVTRVQTEGGKKPLTPLKVPAADRGTDQAELPRKQKRDGTLQKRWEMRRNNAETMTKDMRNWSAKDYDNIFYSRTFQNDTATQNTVKQIMVPQKYRKDMMNIAHEAIIGFWRSHYAHRRATGRSRGAADARDYNDNLSESSSYI